MIMLRLSDYSQSLFQYKTIDYRTYIKLHLRVLYF